MRSDAVNAVHMARSHLAGTRRQLEYLRDMTGGAMVSSGATMALAEIDRLIRRLANLESHARMLADDEPPSVA